MESKVTKKGRDTERALKGTLGTVLVVFLVLWLSSMIPDMPWMFDRKPICDEGKTIVMEGQRFLCKSGQ